MSASLSGSGFHRLGFTLEPRALAFKGQRLEQSPGPHLADVSLALNPVSRWALVNSEKVNTGIHLARFSPTIQFE